ncbi:hypothetical protein BP5796_08033 [Coleophoma crateriformis]|uniref:Luciferase domain-containing protein n=1 Tax=Coleophoma crateriformis TaxID=565419 RepID=A0A3D8RD71_9HELO|nr:hypothetical protein BP5796_08033 [Coleophoma crateriformis]
MSATTLTGLAKRKAVRITVQTPEVVSQSPAHVCLVQQPVLQINLTGKGLVATIASLVFINLVLKQYWTCLMVALAPIPFIVYNDYRNFILLGPGGTPPTLAGWLKITYLRFFALSNPYAPVAFAGPINPPTGYYKRSTTWLPKRAGSRPTIAGIAPHRQIDQPGCPEMYQKLRWSIEDLARRRPELVATDTSCFEKKGLALFALNPINATCRGEICHIHHSDRSMHMNLHPDDAKLVLENGWGERHPLAKGGWLRRYVPREFVMVYAPRNKTELEFVGRIIEAAGFWVSGQRLDLAVEDELALA